MLLLSNGKLAAWYNLKSASNISDPVSKTDLIEIARYELNSYKWPFLDSFEYQVVKSGDGWSIHVTTGNAPGNHTTVVVDSNGIVQNTLAGK